MQESLEISKQWLNKRSTRNKLFFALVNHIKGRDNNTLPTVFELNESELKSANDFVLSLKKLTRQNKKDINKKTILAALSLLSEETDDN